MTLFTIPLSHLCDLFSWNGPEVSPPITSTRSAQIPLISALVNCDIDSGICPETTQAMAILLNVIYLYCKYPQEMWIRNIHYQKRSYGIYAKQSEKTCLWYFDLLEMAWHQPQTSIVCFIATLTCWVMDAKFNLHCPQLKINNILYRNVSFINSLLKIAQNFQQPPGYGHSLPNIFMNNCFSWRNS